MLIVTTQVCRSSFRPVQIHRYFEDVTVISIRCRVDCSVITASSSYKTSITVTNPIDISYRSSLICFDVSSLSSPYRLLFRQYHHRTRCTSIRRADCFVIIVHEEWYCNEPDTRRPEQEELLFPEEFSTQLPLNSMEVIAIVCQARSSITLAVYRTEFPSPDCFASN